MKGNGTRVFVAAGLAVTLLTSVSGSGEPWYAPLVQSTDLVYEGAFRLPRGRFGGSSFEYGGSALAFNAAHGSLFLVGHDWNQQVAEVSIPSIRIGSALTDLATAAVLQPFADPTEGRMATVNPPNTNIKVGGLLAYRGQLFVTAYDFYDANATQALSHFVAGLNVSARGEVRGPYQVGKLGAGFVSGYFGLVPDVWQEAFGGPVLNGNCCLSIISRTSHGPALFSIDPMKLGTAKSLEATPLVYYPTAHPLAAWDSTNPLFNGATEIKGVVFPENTRSVLLFGRHGVGTFCYGAGGAAGADCADPTDSSKGSHAYPYRYQVWAYDANDLAAVKVGRKRAWDVRPYATWFLDLAFASANAHLNGATYDPGSGRILVSQAFGDGEQPLIHVLTVRRSTSRQEY